MHSEHVDKESTAISAYDDHNETTESTTVATGEDLKENESTANISENEISCSESGQEFGSSSFENSESRSIHECVRTEMILILEQISTFLLVNHRCLPLISRTIFIRLIPLTKSNFNLLKIESLK